MAYPCPSESDCLCALEGSWTVSDRVQLSSMHTPTKHAKHRPEVSGQHAASWLGRLTSESGGEGATDSLGDSLGNAQPLQVSPSLVDV